MSKLKWKQDPDSYKTIQAFASRGLGGGMYRIVDDGRNGCSVALCEKSKGGRYDSGASRCWTIGTTANRTEAIALAQAHNEQRALAQLLTA